MRHGNRYIIHHNVWGSRSYMSATTELALKDLDPNAKKAINCSRITIVSSITVQGLVCHRIMQPGS